MIRHVFLWRLVDPATSDKVIDALSELPSRIDLIKNWTIGPNLGVLAGTGQPWDGGLVCDFESRNDLDAYLIHPLHQQSGGRLLPLFADLAIVDFEISGSESCHA